MYEPITPLEHTLPVGGTVRSGYGWYRGQHLASGGQRIVAATIDYTPPLILLNVPKIGFFIAGLLVGWNSVYMVARTGQSLGKRLLDLTVAHPVLDPHTGAAWMAQPTVGRLILRLFCHFLDLMLFVGVLRMCFNHRRESFADSIANTLVIRHLTEELVEIEGIPDR